MMRMFLLGQKSTSNMYMHKGRIRSNICNCNGFKSRSKYLRFSHHNNFLLPQSLYLNFEAIRLAKTSWFLFVFLSNMWVSCHWKTTIPRMPPLWATEILKVKSKIQKFLDSNHPRLRFRDLHFADFE